MSDGIWLTVSEASSPGFAITVCAPRWLRIAAKERALLWARICNSYCGYDVLRGSSAAPIGVIPPIRFELAHAFAGLSEEAKMAAWARHFAEALAASSASPLENGEWLIAPVSNYEWYENATVRQWADVVSHKACEYVSWDHCVVPPLPLRPLSHEEDGRVKAWRKLARSGDLPPLLLLWVSGLCACVVLDGHDRLLAASLEGAHVQALVLSRGREVRGRPEEQEMISNVVATALEDSGDVQKAFQDHRKFTTGKANRMLLDAYVPMRILDSTYARTLEGGYSRWSDEVRQEAARQGLDASSLLYD